MTQQPLVGQGLFIVEASGSHTRTHTHTHTHTHTQYDWKSDQPYTKTSNWQHKTLIIIFSSITPLQTDD